MDLAPMTRLALVSAALAGLALASSWAVAAPMASKSCHVLSPGAAAALYGAPLDPPREMFPSCAYFGPGGDDKNALIVMFMDQPGVATLNTYNQLSHADATSTVEPVSGLAERAEFVTTRDGGGTTIVLHVFDHNRLVDVGAQNSPNPNIKAAIIQAVREILQKN